MPTPEPPVRCLATWSNGYPPAGLHYKQADCTHAAGHEGPHLDANRNVYWSDSDPGAARYGPNSVVALSYRMAEELRANT